MELEWNTCIESNFYNCKCESRVRDEKAIKKSLHDNVLVTIHSYWNLKKIKIDRYLWNWFLEISFLASSLYMKSVTISIIQRINLENLFIPKN